MEASKLLTLMVVCNSWLWMLWPAAVVARTSMKLDSSLSPGADPLFSSATNPAFMLSFRFSPGASPTKLYLCVSFVVNVSMPGQCVWTANRDAPVASSASLQLTSSGNLRLSDSSASSSPTVWNSSTSGLGVVRLLLLSSGNLVLVNSTSGGYVWQSFHYPTDTLLPGQDFTAQSTTRLIANKKPDDFSSGGYSLFFDLSQGLQLSSDSQSYWGWGQIDNFRFDELGNVTLFNSPSSINATFVANDVGITATRRMTLDVDGNLRMYSWNATSAQWIVVWMAFPDVCSRVPGLCGDYGVCVYSPIQPTCMCPQGFSVVDPTNLRSGCKANYDIDPCGNIQYVEMENVDYPNNDISWSLSLSMGECKSRCTSNCNCMVAVYWQADEYGKCWLKHVAQNGASVASQKHRVFLKISASDPFVSNPIINTATNWSFHSLYQPSIQPSPNQQSSIQPSPNQPRPNQPSKIFLSVVIALAVVIVLQALCFTATVAALIKRSRRRLKYMKLQGELEGSPLVCSYEELRVATKNFSDKLGAGGFGSVYKGQLQNGKIVAVKQLDSISQQEQQFRAEIITIGRIHHINLLRLVGFCSEGTHRLLVYEYMEKGSLDQVLFENKDTTEEQPTETLEWKTRFQICLGVARGLHYLHEECLDCILHCDIKPQNILLDGSFSAKVADFGLAYLYRRDHTVKVSTIRGTRGYLAPEWVSNLPITSKADVYSYGMLIMEIISGRNNYLYTESAMMEAGERWCFPMWAYGKRVAEVVDSRLDQRSLDWGQVEDVLKIGFACIQSDMNARPSMGTVVQMIEGNLPIPDVPPPFIFSQGHPFPGSFSLKSSTTTSSSGTSQALSTAKSSDKLQTKGLRNADLIT